MRGLKKKLLGIGMSTFFVLGSFVGCGAEKVEEKPKETALGYQWKAEKDGEEIYLIGTMHPINTEYNYFSEKIEEIIKNTDVLSLEVNPTDEETIQVAANMIYTNGQTIESDLNKEEIEKLKAICKDAELDYEKIKAFKAPGVVQNISEAIYKKANLKMLTFDDMLKERYKKDKKEVDQVEDIKFQMNMLDGIQGIEQLKESLKEYKPGEFEKSTEEDVKYAKDIMEAYKAGDEKFMDKAIAMQKENPETYKMLIKDRNVGMVKKIEEYIKADKKYVVAVGALHFFGEDGIVKMLQEKGYTVTKL